MSKQVNQAFVCWFFALPSTIHHPPSTTTTITSILPLPTAVAWPQCNLRRMVYGVWSMAYGLVVIDFKTPAIQPYSHIAILVAIRRSGWYGVNGRRILEVHAHTHTNRRKVHHSTPIHPL